MDMLFDRKIALSKDFNKFVSAYVSYSKALEMDFFYNGMSNNELKEDTFGERVYQLSHYDLSSENLKTNIKDNLMFINTSIDGETFTIGNVKYDEKIKEIKNPELRLWLSGGKYKQVVANENGVESVKQFFEPFEAYLQFYPVENKDNKSLHDKQKEMQLNQQQESIQPAVDKSNESVSPQEIQRRVANGKKEADNDQSLAGCLGAIGLLGGAGLLIWGHPALAFTLFILCFIGAIYSVMPH